MDLEAASELELFEQEGSGYCGLWSMFFTELCLQNPELKGREILERIYNILQSQPDGGKNYLREVARGYSKIIEKQVTRMFRKIYPEIGFSYNMFNMLYEEEQQSFLDKMAHNDEKSFFDKMLQGKNRDFFKNMTPDERTDYFDKIIEDKFHFDNMTPRTRKTHIDKHVLAQQKQFFDRITDFISVETQFLNKDDDIADDDDDGEHVNYSQIIKKHGDFIHYSPESIDSPLPSDHGKSKSPDASSGSLKFYSALSREPIRLNKPLNQTLKNKDKEYNPLTKRWVKKCKEGYIRNTNTFRCVKNVTRNNNKEYNPITKKWVNKCKTGKIRNHKFHCIKIKN